MKAGCDSVDDHAGDNEELAKACSRDGVEDADRCLRNATVSGTTRVKSSLAQLRPELWNASASAELPRSE